jgi:hypothetical protein
MRVLAVGAPATVNAISNGYALRLGCGMIAGNIRLRR